MKHQFFRTIFFSSLFVSSNALFLLAEDLPTETGRPLPTTLHGVTAELVYPLRDLKIALAAHKRRPTVRIVFQIGTDPDDYVQAIRTLRPHAYIMGQILDSTAVEEYSVEEVRERTRDFVETFGPDVDIWEIGNELNGEWLGEPEDINAKALAAWHVVEVEYGAENLRSAVTLNFWPSRDCYAKPWEDTRRFASSMPRELREGVDYLLLSFYETACNPIAKPSVDEFEAIFTDLGEMFPYALLGMGEVGAQGIADGFPQDPTLAEKKAIAKRYYSMADDLRNRLGSRFVGGYFWWYYSQDSVPKNRSETMWPTLERLLNAMPD